LNFEVRMADEIRWYICTHDVPEVVGWNLSRISDFLEEGSITIFELGGIENQEVLSVVKSLLKMQKVYLYTKSF
jgi:hypothetical protein